MKWLMVTVGLATAIAFAAEPTAPRGQAVEACPVLKVSITELPASRQLALRPSVENRGRSFTSGDFAGAQGPEYGIDLAVLWQNRTGHTLRDVTLRLEYQQSRTSAFRAVEQQFKEVPPGGRWTFFKLRGGEYLDTHHIAAWRVSVVSAGQVLGRKQSMMWAGR